MLIAFSLLSVSPSAHINININIIACANRLLMFRLAPLVTSSDFFQLPQMPSLHAPACMHSYDVAAASRMLGRQVGRVVGVLQGARARADRFTADNELRQLQNELRSSLRELDTVRGELAVAATGSGLMGRGLGSMVPGANRTGTGAGTTSSSTSSSSTSSPSTVPNSNIISGSAMSSVAPTGHDYLAAARSAEASASTSNAGLGGTGPVASGNPLGLAPRSQSVAAVAEEEWVKQGIGFTSRAERGTGAWEGMMGSGSGGAGEGGSNASGQATAGGGVLLADVIQQSLIYDQHDRAVKEQEEALAQRAERIRREKLQQQENRHDGDAESGSKDR